MALILILYNGYRIYVDIMTGKKLSSISVANMDITYLSVRASTRRGEDFLYLNVLKLLFSMVLCSICSLSVGKRKISCIYSSKELENKILEISWGSKSAFFRSLSVTSGFATSL